MPSTAIRTALTGRVLHITIDRPARMNALGVDDLGALDTAIGGAEAAGARVIVLTGAGRAFCTGADLTAVRGEAPEVMMDAANRVIRAIVSSPVPVVAAVNGPAVGYGVALACAADLTYAAESAYFLLSFTSIGLMPDGGATALLAAAIGRARATESALLGQRLSATDAARAGLVARTLPDDRLAAHVEAVAERLGAGRRRALELTRRALAATTLGHLDDAFERERAGQIELFTTPDFAEGVEAVLTKRRPTFS
ncbi:MULTISPECIES: enoyl-CoA hydratase [Rhodococcus]|uniref:enoyl-CoA hydratase n=1 Tax=Rhodococcus TaxID=1827 RepID=UPI00101ED478|nr:MULTISPECIES: enoyl-CoA hydratase [Rhodococcus]UTT51108.1 enoyl-CoA hydratase [Rhodococcus gordoniae]